MRLQSSSLEPGVVKLTPVTTQHGRSGQSGAGREMKIPFLHLVPCFWGFSTPILTWERVSVIECIPISSILYTFPSGWLSYWAAPPSLQAPQGCFQLQTPKYSGLWDVSKVLDYLISLGDGPLSTSLLTKKLAILLALVSAQRSDLVRLSLPVSKTTSGISILLTGLAKQAQPGNTTGMEPLYIEEFPMLCPVRCRREYVTRTQA